MIQLSSSGAVSAARSASTDAFARWRVSEPETVFDSKQTASNAPEFFDDQLVSGSGGGSAWSQATASTVLSVDAATACRRARQSKMRMNYKPGKSQLVFSTFTFASGGGAGIVRSVGLFDDDNGIFLRDNEGTLEMVVRSSTSGSAVDDAVAQSDWNLDPLDGTGPSGVALDMTKSQIWVADYEWLGVGSVRCGVAVAGRVLYAHSFDHSNLEAGVYMSTPNLPVRWEISSSGDAEAGAASLETICATVISEGGNPQLGLDHAHTTGSSVIQANTSGTRYAVIGARLKATKLDATVLVNRVTAVTITNDDYLWELVMNPTIAGASRSWSSESSAPYEVAVGDTALPSTNTVTGGHVLAAGFGKAGAAAVTDTPVDTQLRLGSLIDGTQDEIWLVVTPLAANADVRGGISVRDVT